MNNSLSAPFEHERRRLLTEFSSAPVPPDFLTAFAELSFSTQECILAKSVLQIEGTARPKEVRALEFALAGLSCIRALITRSKPRNYTVGPFQIGIITSLRWTRTPSTPSAYLKRMLFLASSKGSTRLFRLAMRRSGAVKKDEIDHKRFSDFYNGIGNFIPHSLKYHEVLLHLADSHRTPVHLSETAARRIRDRVTHRLQRVQRLIISGEELGAVVMISSVSAKNIIFSEHFGSRGKSRPVINTPRAVGSTLKIALYSAALDSCPVTRTTLVNDEPIKINWRNEEISPRNADRRFRGPVSLEYAFANSINIPAIKMAQMLGIENFVNYLRRCGIQRPLPNSPLIALGAIPLTGQELLSTLMPICSRGTASWPKFPIYPREIRLNDGERILSLETCQTMRQLLKATITNGTAQFLNKLSNPGLGGKTGTSEGNRDLWFVGVLTEDIIGLVWLGFEDGRSIISSDEKDASSSRLAVPLWYEVASGLLDDTMPNFLHPADDHDNKQESQECGD